MNYFKQLLCGRFSESSKGSKPENHPCSKANHGDAEDEINKNTVIHEAKTNKSDHNTDCMEIFDSSLVTSDSSDVVSNYLADSTESLTLDDVSTEVSDNTTTNNIESLNKPGNNSDEDIKESGNQAEQRKNVNVLSISDEDVKMNYFNDNINLLHENTEGLSTRYISINENNYLQEIQDNSMDFDDTSKDTNNNTEILMSQKDGLNTVEQITEVDNNMNNADVLTQFIENNIVDFVQTPRNISEILSSLIEFDITPTNSFSNFANYNNDVNNCDDEYVLMDLDSIVDEIESIDSYIKDISKSHDMEVLNVITPQDVDNILNDNPNDSILPQLSTIGAGDISTEVVPLEKIELQDFEQQIDLINSSMTHKYKIPAAIYDFNIEIDVESVLSQHSDNFLKEAKSTIMLTDTKSNGFLDNVNKTDATEKPLDNADAGHNIEDTFVNSTTSKTEIIHIENQNEQLNKQECVKIIDTIIISSSDDEENYPLALLKKRKNITVKRTRIASDHISISSTESNTESKEDTDYCSGYESSDFEFITEAEAKKSGITIKERSRAKSVKQPPKKTFKIRSIQRLNSDRSIVHHESFTRTNSLNHYFGPIGFNNNVNKPCPNVYNNMNKPGFSGLSNVDNPCSSNLNENLNKINPRSLNNVNQQQCRSGFKNVNNPSPTYVIKPGLSGFNNKQQSPTGSNNNPQSPSGINNIHPGPSWLINYQPGLSGIINDPPGPSGINNHHPGLSWIDNNLPGPSGMNNNHPGPSGMNNNYPGPSCLENNQAGPSGINNEQPGPSGINNEQPGPSGLNNNHPCPSGIDNNHPGPSCLTNNNQSGPNGSNNNKSDQLNNKATEHHVIPEGEEYLNLFQGMYDRVLRPNPYALENKSIYEPNPRIPGMFIDMHGVGFDMAARQNQPYDEDIDDKTRAEASQNRNRILEMYAGVNRRKRRC